MNCDLTHSMLEMGKLNPGEGSPLAKLTQELGHRRPAAAPACSLGSLLLWPWCNTPVIQHSGGPQQNCKFEAILGCMRLNTTKTNQ